MGAASSCCAVEEGENREVMRRDTPSGEASHHRSTNGGRKREDRKKRQSGGGSKSSGGASGGGSGGDASSRGAGAAFLGGPTRRSKADFFSETDKWLYILLLPVGILSSVHSCKGVSAFMSKDTITKLFADLYTSTTQAEVDALKGRLLAGMNTIVLLQDGTQLACLLLYNPSELCLSISCEDKVRVIPLSDVKALLYTRDQLQRVETKANLVGDQCCVALHLQESGNCIPLRFDSPADKAAFVELIKHVKAGGT